MNDICKLKSCYRFSWFSTAELELQFARENLVFANTGAIWALQKWYSFLEGICSNVNIGDVHLFFELLPWNIDVYEFLFQAEYFPRKFWVVGVSKKEVFGNTIYSSKQQICKQALASNSQRRVTWNGMGLIQSVESNKHGISVLHVHDWTSVCVN